MSTTSEALQATLAKRERDEREALREVSRDPSWGYGVAVRALFADLDTAAAVTKQLSEERDELRQSHELLLAVGARAADDLTAARAELEAVRDQAAEAFDAAAAERKQLREALELTVFYVENAAQRLYDGSQGAELRAEASRRLGIARAALVTP